MIRRKRHYLLLTAVICNFLLLLSMGDWAYALTISVPQTTMSVGTSQMQAVSRTESLNVNRDISISIEGGYNSDYSSITGTTSLVGSIRTYAGGGTLTIKNFILSTQ